MALALDGPLLLVGAGKMGGALLSGWLARGLDPREVLVQDPAPSVDAAALLAAHSIAVERVYRNLERKPAVILIAVKPQLVDQVAPDLVRLAGPNTLVISIAAGRTVASLERQFTSGAAIVRSMPNTPAAIGRGISVCCANARVTREQRSLCHELLSAVGEVEWVDNEALLDPVTAVSGSGPAYVFLLAEYLAAAGVAAGLETGLACRLARQTVAGAGALLAASDKEAATLRQDVTSPGGTTAAALEVLMADDGFRALLTRAVAAATARSRELAS
jgi:pyrroline-5-carboxylate reductase